MSIETGLNTYLAPFLTALSPSVGFYWGSVPSGVDEYVILTEVFDERNSIDNDVNNNKQFTSVTKTSMVRAQEIDTAVRNNIRGYKGLIDGKKTMISFVRKIEIPDKSSGEFKIATEYKIYYEEA